MLDNGGANKLEEFRAFLDLVLHLLLMLLVALDSLLLLLHLLGGVRIRLLCQRYEQLLLLLSFRLLHELFLHDLLILCPFHFQLFLFPSLDPGFSSCLKVVGLLDLTRFNTLILATFRKLELVTDVLLHDLLTSPCSVGLVLRPIKKFANKILMSFDSLAVSQLALELFFAFSILLSHSLQVLTLPNLLLLLGLLGLFGRILHFSPLFQLLSLKLLKRSFLFFLFRVDLLLDVESFLQETRFYLSAFLQLYSIALL